MATEIIPVAPSKSFLHISGTDTRSNASDPAGKLSCDPWHVAGARWAHTNSPDANLMAGVKAKLQPQPFPIRIGSTGYINWTGSPFDRLGYTHDATGRMVMAAGDWWGFQRYVHGDVIVWFHRDDPSHVHCSSETIREQIWAVLEQLEAPKPPPEHETAEEPQ